MKRPIYHLTILLIFMLLAPLSHAYDEDRRWYQVEIIVFEPLNNNFGAEDWSKVNNSIDIPDNTYYFPINNATAVTNPQTTTLKEKKTPSTKIEDKALFDVTAQDLPMPDFELLEAEEYFLRRQSGSMITSTDYRPLVHLAWKQPLDTETNIPVFITEGIGLDLEVLSQQYMESIEERLDETMVAEEENNEELENQQLTNDELHNIEGPVLPRLYGTVTLTRGRYLHLDTNLSINREIPLALALGTSLQGIEGSEQDETATTTLRFIHSEKRRLKRKEIHYLDHPALGVIVRVVHADPPQATKELN